MTKIPCVILVYYNFDVIKQTINFLASDERLELYVLENKSPYTYSHIKPYLRQLVANGKIKQYVLFDRNISNNAYELFFDNVTINNKSDYIIITDGDMVVPSGQYTLDWLDEEIDIIKRHPNIECCGINLSPHNLPRNNPFFTSNTNSVYNCEGWIPDKFGTVHESYVEADTGIHLLLFKKALFEEFLAERRHHQWRFLDEVLRNFVKEKKKLKWVITRFNYSEHLTWTLYNDPNHPYTQIKMTPDFYKFWKHFDYCFFTVYTKVGRKRFFPLKAVRSMVKKILLRKQLSNI